MDEEATAYFQKVEEHFIDRRGRPLLLSPTDVQRVAKWHADGVSLEAVIEGIDIHFDRMARRDKPSRRAVTLAYVEDDVLEAWAGSRRRRLGRGAQGAADLAVPSPLTEHARFVDALAATAARLWEGGAVEKAAAPRVEEAAARLERKRELFDPADAAHDLEKAEDALRRRERALLTALREAVGVEGLEAIHAEVAAEVGEKRARMDAPTWERVQRHLVDKKLRERFGVPRLSLFYS